MIFIQLTMLISWFKTTDIVTPLGLHPLINRRIWVSDGTRPTSARVHLPGIMITKFIDNNSFRIINFQLLCWLLLSQKIWVKPLGSFCHVTVIVAEKSLTINKKIKGKDFYDLFTLELEGFFPVSINRVNKLHMHI